MVSNGPGCRSADADAVDLSRPHSHPRYLLVSECDPGDDGTCREQARAALGGDGMNILPSLIERFFTQRLIQQRDVSPHTVASYRDTFRLLLRFAHRELRKAPSSLTLADLNAPFVIAFLDDLERERS